MSSCPSCQQAVSDEARFCPSCGAALGSDTATVTTPGPVDRGAPRDVAQSDPAGRSRSSSDSIDEARFTAGTMLAGRYRIVGLLGKGGMGEVYRADDLKLRQPVALKFLPEALSKDERRLERFLHEVRIARQVSHPNVCRVYDIGETDGQHFISMEYVDGEDLAAILRRLGKPSKEKALQIARQLCAGLAAAHDKGVLHRDLKPHNVMIDGRGVVRITDFGLAGFVEDFAGRDVLAGTPAYMAPEQLAGRGVSVKSDIYSLGLVLFELFTGRRLFEGATREQVRRSHTSAPTALTTLTDDLDPAIERVILRCLEKEPAARPSSALAVAASLPGGDPLAAALAAGETPDPAMVAAAGDVGGLRPAIAIPCLLGAVGLLIALALLNNSILLIRQVPVPMSPAVLAFRAAEIRARLGYPGAPADTATGLGVQSDYLRHIAETDQSPDRWTRLSDDRPPALMYWLRESPRNMIPSDGYSVEWSQPAFDISGMTRVGVDTKGRLTYLEVVPPQRDVRDFEDSAPPQPDWSSLFEAAGFDLSAFEPAEPNWNPSVACDARAAWTGTLPDQPDTPVRIESGAYRGKPNFFDVIYPWDRPWRAEETPVSAGQRAAMYVFFGIVVTVLITSVWLAWRNLRLRRGDRSGAFRISLVVFVAFEVSWAIGAHHVAATWDEFHSFIMATAWSLFWSGWLWVLYVAVEPYVRRAWPQMLISWTRLVSGRWRDPLVGRDMLIGALLGMLSVVLGALQHVAGLPFGTPPPEPIGVNLDSLLSVRHLVPALLAPWLVFLALWNLFVLFALKLVFRKKWIAGLAFVILFTVPDGLRWTERYTGAALYTAVAFVALGVGLLVLTYTRFGLLAAVTALFVNTVSRNIPFSIDFSTWYAGSSLVAMLVIIAVAVYGFHTSLAGRPLWKDELLEA